VTADPERGVLRCGACRARLRARAVDDGAPSRRYDVEVAGRPETRARVDVPWTPGEARRLRAWLLWSTAVTLCLVGVLYALARYAR
jgi:hypothetical protein